MDLRKFSFRRRQVTTEVASPVAPKPESPVEQLVRAAALGMVVVNGEMVPVNKISAERTVPAPTFLAELVQIEKEEPKAN